MLIVEYNCNIMGKILGQASELKILSGIYKSGRLHHAYFFYGDEGIGKFESAMNFAKTILCGKQNGTYCDECASCKNINMYKHTDVVVLSTSERFSNAILFYNQYMKSNAEYLFNDFIFSVRSILYKPEAGFFPAYVNYPVSAPEKYMVGSKRDTGREHILECYYLAVSLTIKELNNSNMADLNSIYKEKAKSALEIVKDRGSKKRSSIEGDFFDALSVLYYNFTHSVIPMDSVRSVIEMTSRKPVSGEKRIFIIEDIDLMDKTAANIFLRTLEEPFDNNIFILLSDNPYIFSLDHMKPLRSRLMDIKFSSLSSETLENIYKKRLKLSDNEVTYCIKMSEGSAGRGIRKLLDKKIDIDNNITVSVLSFFRAVKDKDAALLAKSITSLTERGESVLSCFNSLLIEMIRFRYCNDEQTNELEEVLYNVPANIIIGIIQDIDSLISVLHDSNVQSKVVVRKALLDIVICLRDCS